jgi:hypothetical protein
MTAMTCCFNHIRQSRNDNWIASYRFVIHGDMQAQKSHNARLCRQSDGRQERYAGKVIAVCKQPNAQRISAVKGMNDGKLDVNLVV